MMQIESKYVLISLESSNQNNYEKNIYNIPFNTFLKYTDI